VKMPTKLLFVKPNGVKQTCEKPLCIAWFQALLPALSQKGRWIGLSLLGAMLSACQPSAIPDSNTAESNLKFTAPKTILQVRAVDRDQLRPSVRFSDGTIIPMNRTGENTWSGSINVLPQNSYFMFVDWIETLPDGAELVLGKWAQSVDVGAQGRELVLTEENFDFTVDDDGDGSSNLQERQNNTNPFVHNDQDQIDGEVDGNTDGTTNGNGDNGNDDSATAGDGNSDGTSDGTSDGNDDSISVGGEGTSSASPDGGTTSGSADSGATSGDSIGGSTTSGTDGGTSNAFASVLVPRIDPDDAPVIDGLNVIVNGQDNLIGEWLNAVQFDDSGERLWIDNLMVDAGADTVDGAQHRRWAAMHDGEKLYLLVLSDDQGQRESDSFDHWQDDTLELFIDGNNSKLSTWGDEDDFHVLVP